jgi:hypothetical protein
MDVPGYDRELMGFAHQACIIYSRDLTVPDVLPSVDPHVFHRICLCLHGNIFFFSFFVCEYSRQFQEDCEPLTGKKTAICQVEAASTRRSAVSRDGKHTLMHRLYDSGQKLAIVI